MPLYFSDLEQDMHLKDYDAVGSESLIMPIIKGNKRVETLKLSTYSSFGNMVNFIDISAKKTEIGDYTIIKEVDPNKIEVGGLLGVLKNECKKVAKKYKIDPESIDDAMYSVVSSRILYKDDDNSEKSYLTIHNIIIDGQSKNALNFAVLYSEDATVIGSFCRASSSLQEFKDVIIDIEDSFSAMKALDLDIPKLMKLNKGIQEQQVYEEKE